MKVIHLISGGDTGGAKTHVHSLLQNLSRSAMRTDAAGTLRGFGSLTIGKVSFPWLRVFEIRMEWEVSQ